MIRKYNYKLETGTVGTDDDNIANILYNINRMEMKVSFTSSDKQELDKALSELYFMTVDSKVHLNRFLKDFDGKVEANIVDAILAVLDEAIKTSGNALDEMDEVIDQTDTTKLCAVFPAVYKNLLAIVPSVLALDDQAVGRV